LLQIHEVIANQAVPAASDLRGQHLGAGGDRQGRKIDPYAGHTHVAKQLGPLAIAAADLDKVRGSGAADQVAQSLVGAEGPGRADLYELHFGNMGDIRGLRQNPM
jgi:hypothetical protein